MAYSPPIVSAAGLSVPSFTDIQQSLLDSYQAVYGSTTYLGNDSADYQWISSVALKLFDNCGLCQLAYNNRSPLTAIGVGLDAIVKLNGIARIAPIYSTVTLSLIGSSNAKINYAVVQDANGIQWSLPTSVTLGTDGTLSVIATCNQTGAISAAPNTVNTPVGGFTVGWTSVTNPVAAVVGTVPESDSQLKARQSISVAIPSLTRLAGTEGDVQAVPGVTRTNILENQLSVIDSFGNLSHSITCVVENGDSNAIVQAIYNNKGIGANSLGANPSIPAGNLIQIDVTDATTGNITKVGFVRPIYVPIFVDLHIHPLTAAYNSTMQDNIINSVANYLNSLEIGEIVTQSALYGVALSVMTNLSEPDFSIRALYLDKVFPTTSTIDIVVNFWQVAQGDISKIFINPV